MQYSHNGYLFGGAALLPLAEKYGTPLYVYDGGGIRERYRQLVHAFAGTRMKVKYACKALTNLHILKMFRALGAGLDTVSIQEVELGLLAGFDPAEIIFTPNGASMQEYEQAVEKGVVINIDNIPILEQFGTRYGGNVPVCLRINPHILAGGHHQIATGHIDSKFGISVHQMRHVERVVQTTGIHIHGMHMHTGSEILDTEVFLRGVEILFEAARQYSGLSFIDLGSGFKVAYSADDLSTDVEKLGSRLAARFNAFCEEYGKPLELWFEPGKFFVSEAGLLLVRVNVVKQTTATVFALVDSGFNHLIRPMFYGARHEIINLSNPQGAERIYTVAGNICETDTFAWDRKIREVRQGDVLAIRNAGAYGYQMASNYNSRPRPAEVLITEGKDRLIRRRETLEDLLQTQQAPKHETIG